MDGVFMDEIEDANSAVNVSSISNEEICHLSTKMESSKSRMKLVDTEVEHMNTSLFCLEIVETLSKLFHFVQIM